jgi:hypothetical protein
MNGIIILVLIIVSILWFTSRILLSFSSCKRIYSILKILIDLPQLISALFMPLLVILIPNIYEKIKEKRWYSEKIDVQLKDIDKEPLERYEIEIIENLQRNTNQNDFINKCAENKYFDYVFQLQKCDADFNLIWNNFNYFSSERKRDTQINYWKIIVYRRIIEYFYLENAEKNKYIFIDDKKNKHIVYITPNCT